MVLRDPSARDLVGTFWLAKSNDYGVLTCAPEMGHIEAISAKEVAKASVPDIESIMP